MVEAVSLPFPEAEPYGVADNTWFELTCPHCDRMTLTSMETRDGMCVECDRCSGYFFFRPGGLAHLVRSA